jgi:putative aldouronate transport system substrate-binding protein
MLKQWTMKVFLLVVIASLALSACAPAATQTAEPQPPAAEATATQAAPAEPVATADAAEPQPTAAAGETDSGDWRNTPPYAAYPETVSVTLVKGGQENASLLPEGESIEDNKVVQYIEDTLNIDITYSWVVPSDSFMDKLNLAITSGQIPDIMIVNPTQLQQLTEADAIEDMTPYIQQYANEDILENYGQTNGVALDTATIDGKVMGIPNVQPQADAPVMVWVRQDWLDKLGLEGPETVDDLEALAKAFIEQDPDGNGADDTYGLTGTMMPVQVPSNLHGFDGVFNAYGAFPTLFFRNAEGEVVYGSIQPETREALARLVQMYQDGLIDPDFATKNTDTSNQIVVSGQGGIMNGPWWIPWWPLNDSVKNDPNANWQPYVLKGADGKVTFSMGDYTNSFVVVKKGFSNPEVAIKILNIQNDLSYGFNDAPQYYENFNEIWNVLFPLPFLIEQPYVVERMGREYKQALDGELSPDTFSEAMKVEFEQIKTDVASPRADPASWATRMARLDAALVLAQGYDEVRADPMAARIYPLDQNWPSLKKLEEETFLQIIIGVQPIEYFDTFVERWNSSGGAALLEKMNQ